MKVKVLILPFLLNVLVLRVDFLKQKKYYKPVRNLFYMAYENVPRTTKTQGPTVQEPADKLEYYGNTKGAQGIVAVLSLNGEVYTVREGDTLGKRYRVLKIFSDRVILLDEKKNQKITVKLKEG